MATTWDHRRTFELVAACASDYLDHLPHRSVVAPASLATVRDLLQAPLPEDSESADAVVELLADAGHAATVATTGPRYFGFVTGGVLPAALAAEMLAVAWDQNGGMAVMSPLASVTEEVAGQWILELLGLAPTCSIGFVTGGQAANTTALAAARHHVLGAHDWDVESRGLHGAPRIDVVVGAQRHATVDTSLRFLGLGQPTTVIPADDQGRMVAGDLDAHLAGQSGPAIVCAQAGNVNTGAFDDLATIVATAHRHGAWVHVDGAFGLWAAASPSYRHLLRGHDGADSWAVDGHKWLNVPYDCGYAITAHPQSHRGAFASQAGYYVVGGDDAPRDGFDWVPEASRRARGIATYAALRSLGRRGVALLVEQCCERAQQFARVLNEEPGIRVLNDVVLNQVLVRFGDTDEHTRAVIARVQQEGTCWAGGSTWDGQAAMRISISNWSTGEADVERSAAAMIAEHRRLGG
jgi:glutamate/tyrosine decarboxylase-like PLP-dependent enzyme